MIIYWDNMMYLTISFVILFKDKFCNSFKLFITKNSNRSRIPIETPIEESKAEEWQNS
jgi:hypothetical protein